jgi:hypothetical protein
MATIFSNADALADQLRGRFIRPAIIGIDGWTGVGKTTLANSLAMALGGSFYDVDAALNRDQTHYISVLRLNEIERALEEPLGLLFVSGICLRQVLDSVSAKADAHIYVKRMASWGWADEDEITGAGIPEIAGASGEQVRRELRVYHERWQPHVSADYELHRFA